jgi:hypothetical protein
VSRPRRIPKARTTVLTTNQRSELEMGWNITPYLGPNFRDDAHRREAWEQHREEFLAREPHPGRRPWAFWRFEAPRELWDDPARHYSGPEGLHAGTMLELRRLGWLVETGRLGEDERAQLLAACDPERPYHRDDCRRCLEATIARGDAWQEPPVVDWLDGGRMLRTWGRRYRGGTPIDAPAEAGPHGPRNGVATAAVHERQV